uniref:Outer membrane autotransporter barrel domain-containing protein n=1 Tax=Candidatus Kentrum sp. TUN TaxID=2126343 RepID=A0A450ZZN8_9GAMM|nr:MAG: outer membrane autotransporter barrel domain-containing protein [Candidatus Kentron sp. TUN]
MSSTLERKVFKDGVKPSRKILESKSLKKTLVGGLSVAATAAMLGVSGAAMATDATTEVATADEITATNANGLLESGETGTVTVTVNTGGNASFGTAGGADAITTSESGGVTNLVINATEGATGTTITWAEDINVKGNAGNTLEINHTDTSGTFEGSIIAAVVGNTTTITAGAADSSATTHTLTFDSKANEDQAIDAVINALEGGDTVNISITNSDSVAGNTTTFAKAIGGATAANAIDTITIGASTTTTFSGTVNATTITNSSANTTTFSDDVTGNLDFAADGTASIAAAKKIDGSVDNKTGADGAGTLTIGATGTLVAVSGTVGATHSLKAITVDTTGGVATFTGAVRAVDFTETGGGGVTLTDGGTFTNYTSAGDVTITNNSLDLAADGTITIAAAKKIVGNVDNKTGADGAGTLAIGATGGTVDVVSGTVGATHSLKAITVDTTGGVATFTGAVRAVDFTETGGGGVTLTDGGTFTNYTSAGDVTITNNSLDLAADGTITIAAAKKIVGNVDNKTGADGAGTLAIGATGGTVDVVSGTVGATHSLKAITVDTTGGLARFGGNVKTTSFTATGAGGTAFTVGGTFTNFTSAADVTGGSAALDINGNVNFSAGKLVAGAGHLTLAGSTISAAMTLATGKDVTFDGTAAQTITGLIDGTNNLGKINVTNTAGLVTFNSKIGSSSAVGSFAIGASQVQFEAPVVVGSNKLTIADGATITVGSGITIGTDTLFTTTNGGANITDGGTVDGDGTADITVNLPASFSEGTLTFIKDTITDLDTLTDEFAVTDTALVDYTVQSNADKKIIEITATKQTQAATMSALGVSSSQADAIQAAVAITGDSEAVTAISAIINAAAAAGATIAQKAEATKVAKQVVAQADTLSAASAASVGAGAKAVGAASSRLAYLRSGVQHASVGQSGFSSGDSAGMAPNSWIKTFGNWASQDDEGGVDGYDADTYGFAAGMDAEVYENVRAGVAFSYSNADIEGNGAGDSKVDVENYQVTFYGDYTTDMFYVEGMLGYAAGNNETSRQINAGTLNRTPTAAYDSKQYMFSVGAGIPVDMGNDITVTPKGSVSWTHVSSDNYVEANAGNLGLKVNPDDIDSVVASIGAQIHTKIKQGKGHLVPSAYVGVNYDFADEDASASYSFIGGTTTSIVNGMENEEFSSNIGLGLEYEVDQWSVGINYDGQFKSGYDSHAATLQARYKF